MMGWCCGAVGAVALGVSTGLALDVPGIEFGVFGTNCRPVGIQAMVWFVRGERQRQLFVVIRSATVAVA
jgi:hypothetical protein